MKRGSELKLVAGELEDDNLYETRMVSLRPVVNQKEGIGMLAIQLPVVDEVRHVCKMLAAENDDADTVIVAEAELDATLNEESRT